MAFEDKIVKIFMLPQQNPCGPGSTCCGPVGQTDDEMTRLKKGIEHSMGCNVEIFDASNGQDMKKNRAMLRTIQSLGFRALPLIVIDDDVICMGTTEPKEAVRAINRKYKVPS